MIILLKTRRHVIEVSVIFSYIIYMYNDKFHSVWLVAKLS